MRYSYFLLTSVLLLIGCQNEEEPGSSREDILENGKWVVESISVPMERIKEGIKFSKDKQVFYIDSQGRVIPTYSEIVYELKEDTLRIVDFKYEPRFRYEKGTLVTIVKEMKENYIELEVIHPEENTIVLKKEKL